MRTLALSLTSVAVIASGTATAQIGQKIGANVDVQAIITTGAGAAYNGCLGVTRDKSGNYFVSTRRDTTAATNPHMLFEIDKAGKFVKGYPIANATLNNSWGLRDLAYDQVSDTLYGGAEHAATANKIFAFDVKNRKWDPTKDIPVAASAPSTTTRALAYNPLGNGGKGSFWAANFSSQLWEWDKTGKLLNTVAGWSGAIYGCGYMLGRNTLVWHGQTGSGAPGNPGTCLWLMDAGTGKRTGVAFLGDTTVAHASRPGGVAGGCSAMLQTVNGKPRMVITTLAQANTDTAVNMNSDWLVGSSRCGGGTPTMSNTPPYMGNASWNLVLEKAHASSKMAMVWLGAKAPTPFKLPGLIGAGCEININLPAFVEVGGITVNQGTAQLKVPIPEGLVRGTAVFGQWIEVTSPITLPVRLSSAFGFTVQDDA